MTTPTEQMNGSTLAFTSLRDGDREARNVDNGGSFGADSWIRHLTISELTAILRGLHASTVGTIDVLRDRLVRATRLHEFPNTTWTEVDSSNYIPLTTATVTSTVTSATVVTSVTAPTTVTGATTTTTTASATDPVNMTNPFAAMMGSGTGTRPYVASSPRHAAENIVRDFGGRVSQPSAVPGSGRILAGSLPPLRSTEAPMMFQAQVLTGVVSYVPVAFGTIRDQLVREDHDALARVRNENARLNLSAFERVRSWKLKFAGLAEENVDDFLRRINICKDTCNMADEELFRVVPVLLEGIAYNWWEERRLRFHNYAEFREAFVRRFSNPEVDKCRTIHDIVLRTQGLLEKGSDFIDNIRLMWTHSGAEHFSERCRLDLAFMNLRREYHTMISRRDFTTFDELGELVQDFDERRSLPRLSAPPLLTETIYPECAYMENRYKRSERGRSKLEGELCVVESPFSSSSEDCSSEASFQVLPRGNGAQMVTSRNSSSRTGLGGVTASDDVPVCFTCHEPGHRRRQCPKVVDDVICFGCGLQDYEKPDCPTCGEEGNALAKQ